MSRVAKCLIPLLLIFSAAFAYGQLPICTEDPILGCIAPIPTAPNYLVASDGEQPFFPFGSTFDVSDGVQLDPTWTSLTPGWINIGPGTWVTPAAGGPDFGVFINPNFQWTPDQVGTYVIFENATRVSDIIVLFNNNGAAEINFQSDVPETDPGNLTLAAGSLVCLAGVFRRKIKG